MGAINFVMADAETAKKVLSQLKRIARALYSNPPVHGTPGSSFSYLQLVTGQRKNHLCDEQQSQSYSGQMHGRGHSDIVSSDLNCIAWV